MSNYFVMRNAKFPDEVSGYLEIEDWNNADDFEGWRCGAAERILPTGVVQLTAVPHDGYVGAPNDLSDGSIPLVSARLKTALTAAGVDNVIFIPLEVRNTNTSEVYQHFAFNVIGLVSAADLSTSNILSADGDLVGDSEIHDLVIDESKCQGLLMFRLKEKFSAIMVHRSVKEAVEAAGVDTVAFVEPEDFMLL